MIARLTWWALASCAAAVLVMARLLTPAPAGFATHLALGLPSCVFLAWTGLPCPTCGLTTSFALLARGQVVRAVGVHPMGVPLFLSCLGVLCFAPIAAVRGASLRGTLERLGVDRCALVLMLALWATWLASLASAFALGVFPTGQIELLQLSDQVAAAHA